MSRPSPLPPAEDPTPDKPAPAKEKDAPERPVKVDKAAAEWDELSQQIIAGVCRSNIDFGGMVGYARSFRCELDIRVSSALFQPATGTLSYWWEDADDNGLLVGDEIQVEIATASNPAMRGSSSAIKNALILQTATAGGNVFRDHYVQSVRTPDGYKMKLVPARKDKPVKADAKADKDDLIANRGYDAMYLTVSGDFRVTRTARCSTRPPKPSWSSISSTKGSPTSGPTAATTRRFSKPAARSASRTADANTPPSTAFRCCAGLTITSGITTPQGTVGMKQEYTVRDPKVAWRDKPLDMHVSPAARTMKNSSNRRKRPRPRRGRGRQALRRQKP